MRRKVFTDPALVPLRDHFVWLSVDSESASNREFLARFPADALPMLWVLDAETGRVVLKWNKPATAASLRVLLTTSETIIADPDQSESAVGAHWTSALEAAARGARDADGRIAFDAQLLDAYNALGAPERAIPMLEQSERDFPKWFEPPARLAAVYWKLGRLDDAAKAIARASSRVHGSRSLPVFALAADIALACSDAGAEYAALAKALVETEKVSLTRSEQALRAGIRARLESRRR
jgi:tetratricopeptide (TPR) repeat protein